MTTFGTHNTGDLRGTPTDFADVTIFTEAIPGRVRLALRETHDIYPCPRQPDLVIAFRKGIWQDAGWGYWLAHPGLAKVTPRRGTYRRKGKLNGKRTKVFAEHRINAAFPPYRRGEKWLRPLYWKRHTRMTLRMIRRAKRAGWDVLAGGDLNTPPNVSGYRRVLHEVGSHAGHGYDRLGSSGQIDAAEVLSRRGSDHPRLRATV